MKTADGNIKANSIYHPLAMLCNICIVCISDSSAVHNQQAGKLATFCTKGNRPN